MWRRLCARPRCNRRSRRRGRRNSSCEGQHRRRRGAGVLLRAEGLCACLGSACLAEHSGSVYFYASWVLSSRCEAILQLACRSAPRLLWCLFEVKAGFLALFSGRAVFRLTSASAFARGFRFLIHGGNWRLAHPVYGLAQACGGHDCEWHLTPATAGARWGLWTLPSSSAECEAAWSDEAFQGWGALSCVLTEHFS